MDHTTTDFAAWQVYLAIGLFLVSYAVIISEKINRAVVAMLGGALMVAFGIVDLESAYRHHIEWQTIFLLVGMMILVGITNKTGVFQFVAIKAAQAAKGRPVSILVLLSLLTAVGSAFLDNVTTVLLVVPVTMAITRMLKLPAFPYLVSEIIASNIGGTATLIGDPPNIMIGSANPHLTFNAFLVNLGPPVVVILAVTILVLVLVYRRKLSVAAEDREALLKLDAQTYIQDRPLMWKSIAVLVLTIIGFMLHSALHVEAATIAVLAATVLMLIGLKEHEAEEAFDAVEWVTIFFFVGLFVLVGGLVDTGVIERLAAWTLDITAGDDTAMALLILWVSGIASALIDNIPFVATMIPLVQDVGVQLGIADPAEINHLWWSLALGACLGGNGTLIGASANVVVAGLAAREGQGFGFVRYLLIGAPITLLSLLLATAYVLLVLL